MKHVPGNNEKKDFTLHPIIKEILETQREVRNFNVEEYLNLKYMVVKDYFKESNLDTAVVAISGGIDSALVYAMLKYFQQKEDSPIKDVVALTIPYYKTEGATNQKDTVKKAQDLVATYNGTLHEFELSKVLNKLSSTIRSSFDADKTGWSEGQLVSYLRTPVYYFVTSILSEQGKRAVVVGTTNKDEGAYLGYFGKASDGLVDVQLISDIHKSEVFKLAKFLNVPDSILNAVPTGDMYDGRIDEEVFGASYDFVEFYLNILTAEDCNYKHDIRNILKNYRDAYIQFSEFKENIELLHKYNKHKYLGHSPAIHLDVLPYKLQDGWKYFSYLEGDKC